MGTIKEDINVVGGGGGVGWMLLNSGALSLGGQDLLNVSPLNLFNLHTFSSMPETRCLCRRKKGICELIKFL